MSCRGKLPSSVDSRRIHFERTWGELFPNIGHGAKRPVHEVERLLRLEGKCLTVSILELATNEKWSLPLCSLQSPDSCRNWTHFNCVNTLIWLLYVAIQYPSSTCSLANNLPCNTFPLALPTCALRRCLLCARSNGYYLITKLSLFLRNSRISLFALAAPDVLASATHIRPHNTSKERDNLWRTVIELSKFLLAPHAEKMHCRALIVQLLVLQTQRIYNAPQINDMSLRCAT